MSNKKAEPKKPIGKPPGTRQKDGLYTEILKKLQEDKEQGGDGYTAFAISKYLGETHQTVQQYLADLVAQKKVRQRKIYKMVLFSIK
jgi:DNA invertase Pin-like site-specific DNA recombinase